MMMAIAPSQRPKRGQEQGSDHFMSELLYPKSAETGIIELLYKRTSPPQRALFCSKFSLAMCTCAESPILCEMSSKHLLVQNT